MSERITRENLHGVWAAIPTPFDERERFDEGVFRENVRRLHSAGVHGIYTTDSDGEFYAIELAEFKRIVSAFADEAHGLGIATQVGVTWCNTAGILDRIAFAADCGILGAHVGHPFFMPMTPDSYRAFWADVGRAAPDRFALVHYNTPRVHNTQHGPDYAVLQSEVANLVGTKHVGRDFPEFADVVRSAPDLSHFTGEHAMTPFMMFGARGVYSWFVNFNPRYMLEWYEDIQAGRFEAARHRQERMFSFIRAAEVLRGEGNLHGIVSKAMAAASPFLEGVNRTRRPYLPVSADRVERFKRVVLEEFPDMLWEV
jgi:4-hydroxy-tetrahydrodipicolinate synthase